MSNGYINGDEKLESWSKISDFFLSKQTFKALITTLRPLSFLIKELLEDGYDFILGRRLQSDPFEKRFSQNRQFSGGRLLVSLRKVITSERILTCRSLLKRNLNFWEEKPSFKENPNVEELINIVSEHETEIFELSLSPESEEVSFTIAGYVAIETLQL